MSEPEYEIRIHADERMHCARCRIPVPPEGCCAFSRRWLENWRRMVREETGPAADEGYKQGPAFDELPRWPRVLRRWAGKHQ